VPNTGRPRSRLALPEATSCFEAEQQNKARDQTKPSRTSRETKEVVKCEHQEKGQKKKKGHDKVFVITLDGCFIDAVAVVGSLETRCSESIKETGFVGKSIIFY